MKKMFISIIVAAIMFPGIALAADCEPEIEKAVWENVEIYRVSSLGSIEYRGDLYRAFSAAAALRADCEIIRLASEEEARARIIDLVRKGVIRPAWRPVKK